MAKVFVKLYDSYTIRGSDFGEIADNGIRSFLFSPDRKHALILSKLPDGCLLIKNEGNAQYDFSITRDNSVIANVHVKNGVLLINSNWKVTEEGVINREIHTNPDLFRSTSLNFNVNVDGMARVDVKVNASGYAAMVFSRELLFVRMNGNRAVPRLMGFIQNEKDAHLRNMKKAVGKAYFRKVFAEKILPANPNN